MLKLKSVATGGCSFCWENQHKRSEFPELPYKELFRTNSFVVRHSLFPVTSRHLLIISLRCFEKATDMTFLEVCDFFKCRQRVEEWYKSQGVKAWNSGDNFGKDAGQSRKHFHYHYFDRKQGDVKDPRGGIRNFMSPVEELADYRDET